MVDRPLLAALFTPVLACTGVISDAGARPGANDPVVDIPASSSCASDGVGESPLRRLTAEQYQNAIADLLSLSREAVADAIPTVPGDEHLDGFRSNSIAPLSELHVVQYMEAAEAIAVAFDPAPLLDGCDPVSDGVDTCARVFVGAMAPRAFRRPLAATETEAYVALIAGEASFEDGVRLAVEAILQSPKFLYRVEGTEGEAEGALSGYEVATRLSFLLWNTIPDPGLMDAAAEGALDDVDGVRAEVRRMLDDPRSRRGVTAFHLQWLELDGLDAVDRDPAEFPDFTPELARAMQDETESFVEHVVFEGDARLETLLGADFSIVSDSTLREHYGVTGSDEVVDLRASPRRGLLTQAAFLTRHASEGGVSPVFRGLAVRERMLCQPIPAPPPGAAADVMVDPDASARDTLRQHREDPACSGCHSQMDPIGFAFERFDAIGAERGVFDDSGELEGTDVDGPLAGASDLADRLSTSELVQDCYATQWFRFAFGRDPSAEEACTLRDMRRALETGGVVELIVTMTLSRSFRTFRDSM